MKFGTIKSIGYLAIGVIIGVTGMLTTRVIASTGTKTTTVTYRDIKVVMDGVPTVLTDPAGTVLEPVILFDRCYVPLAGIGRALNRDVTFDNDTSTVYINKKGGTSTVGTVPVKMTTLSPVAPYGKFNYFEGMLDNTNTYITDCWTVGEARDAYGSPAGRGYSNAWNALCASRSYDLNRGYARVEGTFYMSLDGKTDKDTYTLMMYTDNGNTILYESPQLKAGGKPISFSVNLDDVSSLNIYIYKSNLGDPNDTVGLSNVTFYKYSDSND